MSREANGFNHIITQFLNADTFAVAGASARPHKYGFKVFDALINSGRRVFPINPTSDLIAGHQAYASISDLPTVPQSISIVTPPAVTRQIVTDAMDAGVQNLWMQPGAEDAESSRRARGAGLNVIDDGSCILVQLVLDP